MLVSSHITLHSPHPRAPFARDPGEKVKDAFERRAAQLEKKPDEKLQQPSVEADTAPQAPISEVVAWTECSCLDM